MKKKLLIIVMFYSIILLSWCNLNQPVEKNIIKLTGNQKTDTILSWDTRKQDISIYGDISSGIDISWQYSSIKSSWDVLYYDNIFNIRLFQDAQKRLYDVTYFPIVTWYSEWLWINDLKDNSISIKSHSIIDIISLQWENLNIQDLCMPHYEEWIHYQPKTIEKTIWEKKIYITYSTFDVSGPDMKPFKNYQAEICFVENDRIYTISIGDIKNYRKDIVDSFNFIKIK